MYSSISVIVCDNATIRILAHDNVVIESIRECSGILHRCGLSIRFSWHVHEWDYEEIDGMSRGSSRTLYRRCRTTKAETQGGSRQRTLVISGEKGVHAHGPQSVCGASEIQGVTLRISVKLSGLARVLSETSIAASR